MHRERRTQRRTRAPVTLRAGVPPAVQRGAVLVEVNAGRFNGVDFRLLVDVRRSPRGKPQHAHVIRHNSSCTRAPHHRMTHHNIVTPQEATGTTVVAPRRSLPRI